MFPECTTFELMICQTASLRYSEEPRASANGRRWSARGFFQRKSLLAIHPRSSERGILAFSREKFILDWDGKRYIVVSGTEIKAGIKLKNR